jgi:hypothetical protein
LNETAQRRTQILVIGDLNVDLIFNGVRFGSFNSVAPEKRVGGSAFNAARAFREAGYHCALFGKRGPDSEGDFLLRNLEADGFDTRFVGSVNQPTGVVYLLYDDSSGERTVLAVNPCANDYDVDALKACLAKIGLTEDDTIFYSTYIFDRSEYDLNHCVQFSEVLSRSPARLIADIVPHQLYRYVDSDFVKQCLPKDIFMLIGERRTFSGLILGATDEKAIEMLCDERISEAFCAQHYVLREGIDNVSEQTVFHRDQRGHVVYREKKRDTDYGRIPHAEKIGFGDWLTADLLHRMERDEGSNK